MNAEVNQNISKKDKEFYESIKEVSNYCNTFGCGKILTLLENLMGDKCTKCKTK